MELEALANKLLDRSRQKDVTNIWFGNIHSHQKEYKAPDKLYEVFSRTDHPRLPVVLSNEIIGAGRLNSIASYFNYLV